MCRYGNDKIEKLHCNIRITILSYEEPNSGIYTKEQRSIIFSCSSDSSYSDLLRCPLEICNEPFSYADPMADNYYFKMRFHIVDDQSAKWSTSSRHLGNKTIRFNKVFHLCIF